MKLKWKIILGLGLIVTISVGAFAAIRYSKRGIVSVQTGRTVRQDLISVVTASGEIKPRNYVNIGADAIGRITEILVKEGDRVRKGDVLFEIDPRPFQAALAQAQANLAKDQAQLDRAKTQDARNLDLLKQNFISKDAYEQFKTNVETAAATVRGDQAAVDNAKLQLDYCTIRSTLDGYAGRILIQEGNLVKANDTNPLVTINQIVPVFTTFSVPEQNLPEIREHQAKGDLVVQTTLPSGTHPPITGRLSFIDNSADTTTGTIRLKAEFANKDTALWPGQFVNVVLTLYEQDNAVVTPSTAIQNGPNGQYVFVVKPDHTVELRNIKIDRAVGDDTVIASGLQPGETVVTAGQLRLAPGSRVTVDGAKAA